MARFTPQTFNAQLGRMINDLGDKAMLNAVGMMAKEEAEKAASADLGGDPKFSGWAPTLDTRYDIVDKGRISFHPTRRSAGPWTVAELGRNQGNASGFSGPGINRKTGLTSFTKSGGVRRQRSRGARRWNGRTAGKHTASEAVAAIKKKAPNVVNEQVGLTLRKFFD